MVKVLDFGLAKATRRSPVDGGLTHDGQMLGTPDFIAPEQIRDAQEADPRRHLQPGLHTLLPLTGGPPFQGRALWTSPAHHSMDAKPLNLARPEVPVELAALVAKMMAKEPARRFQTPKEVAQALTPFFKKGSADAHRPLNAEITQVEQSVSSPEAPVQDSVPGRDPRRVGRTARRWFQPKSCGAGRAGSTVGRALLSSRKPNR